MTRIFNRTEFKKRRKRLRNNATQTERMLWECLKGKRLEGLKFRRQHGVGIFVTDFYCPEKKLAIEIDGDIHNSQEAKDYDQSRDEYFKTLSITTLRIKSEEVISNLNCVLKRISEVAGKL